MTSVRAAGKPWHWLARCAASLALLLLGGAVADARSLETIIERGGDYQDFRV